MNKQLHQVSKQAIENLKQFLLEKGYEDVTPVAYSLPNNTSGVTLDTYTTEYPQYQYKNILVTTSAVYLFGKNPPTSYSEWVLLDTTNYTTKDELINIVKSYTIDANAESLWV